MPVEFSVPAGLVTSLAGDNVVQAGGPRGETHRTIHASTGTGSIEIRRGDDRCRPHHRSVGPLAGYPRSH
jgi:hypothetical protein